MARPARSAIAGSALIWVMRATAKTHIVEPTASADAGKDLYPPAPIALEDLHPKGQIAIGDLHFKMEFCF